MTVHRQLVAPDFEVPVSFETSGFRLRMLSVRDLVIDYEAVMASVDHLQSTYSLISGSEWPVGLTIEEDLVDLGWHQKEFRDRSSFAYTVVTLDETRCLGCVYLNPTSKRGYDVEVKLWVRASEVENGLDEELFQAVKTWVRDCWPFANPAYPMREIALEKWRAAPEAADLRVGRETM